MAATILLLRHAVHTQFNRCLSGRAPGVPLSAEGREQARALAEHLSRDGIARVEASPLERTMDTARIVAEAVGSGEVARSEALIEIDMGEWTGLPIDGFGDDPLWRAWNQQRGSARIPGGESMAEAQARIVGHIRQVASAHDGSVIALVTHSDMIRAAIAWALGLPLDNLLRFDIEPASISRMVVGDWGARVLSVNERVQ